MSTTTTEDQLTEPGRRIVQLDVLSPGLIAENSGSAPRPRHAAGVGGSHGPPRETPDEVEEKLGQLRTRLAVAENSLAATSPRFDDVRRRRRGRAPQLDTYLERLQATAAANAGNARERAEAAIGEVRTPPDRGLRPPRAGARLVNGAWREQRTTSARLATSSNRRPTSCRRR